MKQETGKMNSTHITSSIGKKYITGYIFLGAFIVMLLVFSLFENQYISRKYAQTTTELIAVNELEKAVSDLNESVNLGYLYLSPAGIAQYKGNQQRVETALQNIREQQERRYLRELDDAGHTVETYVEQSDALVAVLSDYLKQTRRDTQVYSFLEEEYAKLQDIYRYTNLRFQSTYTAKLGKLSETEREIEAMQRLFTAVQLGLLGLAVLLCGVYIFRVIREMQASIRSMMNGVAMIRENIADAKPIEIRSNDEFRAFADAFNQMTSIIRAQMKRIEDDSAIKERLAALEIENLRIYGELQKSHLNFLQSRINPHFLFNTLNMISSLARIEEADKCAELMETTAAFLRYNLDNISKTVTLAKEIDNLKDYIAIQQCRYGERYRFEIHADPECMGFGMPCMILQPLVENSLQHGLAMKLRDGMVGIFVRPCGAGIEIEVRDNGVGMTEEQIAVVERELHSRELASSHIGIHNIYHRLRLFYNGKVRILFQDRAPGLSIFLKLGNTDGGDRK